MAAISSPSNTSMSSGTAWAQCVFENRRVTAAQLQAHLRVTRCRRDRVVLGQPLRVSAAVRRRARVEVVDRGWAKLSRGGWGGVQHTVAVPAPGNDVAGFPAGG